VPDWPNIGYPIVECRSDGVHRLVTLARVLRQGAIDRRGNGGRDVDALGGREILRLFVDQCV
jgi:hypothetical protein